MQIPQFFAQSEVVEESLDVVRSTGKDLVKETGSISATLEKVVVGRGVTGGIWNKIVKSTDFLTIIESAKAPKSGGEFIVGHALQKHAGRYPEIWNKVSGNADSINKIARCKIKFR